MFGWFRRKSRDRLAPLAAASAERRVSRSRTCEDDTNALLDHALRLATFFLEGGQLPTFLPVRDGFPPFGAGISPGGEIVDFNCLPAPGNPGLFNVFRLDDQLAMAALFQQEESPPRHWHKPPPVEAVAQAMKQCAAAGGIHAGALVDGLTYQAGQQSAAEPVIRVRLEHVEADPVTWHLPYRITDRKLARGALAQLPGQWLVFAE